eukprot:3404748-Amphidinium_carterae.1
MFGSTANCTSASKQAPGSCCHAATCTLWSFCVFGWNCCAKVYLRSDYEAEFTDLPPGQLTAIERERERVH